MAIVSSFLTKKKPNSQPNFIVNYHLIWKHFNDLFKGVTTTHFLVISITKMQWEIFTGSTNVIMESECPSTFP